MVTRCSPSGTIASSGWPAARDSTLSSRFGSRSRSRLFLAAAGPTRAVTSSAARPLAARLVTARPANRRLGELEAIMGETLGWRVAGGRTRVQIVILGKSLSTKRNLNAGYRLFSSPPAGHLYVDLGRMREGAFPTPLELGAAARRRLPVPEHAATVSPTSLGARCTHNLDGHIR